MADRFVISHIRRLPLFSRLTPDQIEWVGNAVQVLRFEPGEVVFRQGDITQGILMFVSGRGTLIEVGPDGIERQVGSVSPNEYINESSLFVETTASVTLRVVETAIALFISRQQFATVLTHHPELKNHLHFPKSYMPVTEGKTFRAQRENETVLVVCRRHWWAFVRRWFVPLLLAAGLIVVAVLAGQNVPFLGIALGGLGVVVAGTMMVYYYLEWYNDSLIITDQRVTHIERTILTFRTKINEVPLSGINEVNASIPGDDPFAPLFNYGNLIVKTSGDTNNITMNLIPNPKAVQNIIFTRRSRYKENEALQNRNAIRADIDQFLGRTPSAPADPSQPSAPPGSQPPGLQQQGFNLLRSRFTNSKGETVYRKHIFVWFSKVALPGLVVLGGATLFVTLFFGAATFASLGAAGYLIALAIMAFGVLWFFWADWDWRNDLYIVGDQMITLIHRRPLWLQNRNEQILLSQVDNVVADTSGLLSTLLQMGTVRLRLVGVEERNAKVFTNVHRPHLIQEEISQRQERARMRQRQAEVERQRQAIVEYLAVYHESLGNTPPSGYPPANAQQQPTQTPPMVDRTRPPRVPRARSDGTSQ